MKIKNNKNYSSIKYCVDKKNSVINRSVINIRCHGKNSSIIRDRFFTDKGISYIFLILFFISSLCLRAFSWVSVIEILKAATAMLKPIRLGTVKAQPKGIIRDIHNIGQASSSRGNIHSGM